MQNHLIFETIFNRSTHFEIRGVEMIGNNNQHAQGATKPKLLDQVQNTIRLKRYSIRNEQSYLQWIKLTHLAVRENVSSSTRNQPCRVGIACHIPRIKIYNPIPVLISWMSNAIVNAFKKQSEWLGAQKIPKG